MKKIIFSILATVTAISTIIVTPATAASLPILTSNEVDLEVQIVDNYTVHAKSQYDYTASQINDINNGGSFIPPQVGYYTLDLHAVDSHGAAENSIPMGWNGDYYTNFPDPYPDGDDDDGNGFDEEVEIVVRKRLTFGTDYVFAATFEKFSSLTSGIIGLAEQYSIGVEIGGDKYNTVPFTSHEISFWWFFCSRNNASLENVKLVNEPSSEHKIFLNEDVSSLEELNELVSRKNREYINSLSKNQINSSNSDTSHAVLTFSHPISMDEMVKLLNDSDANLINYQAKFINVNNDWCTYGSSSTNEDEMIRKANQFATQSNQPHVKYEGIVCAEVTFSNPTSYNMLNNSDLVFFVDMSLMDLKENDVDVILTSYAWDLAKFQGEEDGSTN